MIKTAAVRFKNTVMRQIPEAIVSLGLIGVLTAFFIAEIAKKRALTAYEVVFALLSLILFCLCGGACIFLGGKEIRAIFRKENSGELCGDCLPGGLLSAKPSRKRVAKDIALIVSACIVFFLITMLLTVVITWANGSSGSFAGIIRYRYGTLDSQHYLYIAEHGYTPATSSEYGRVVEIVFFPGYPLLVKLVSFIVQDYFAAGMIVSFIAFTASAILLYLLMSDEFCREDALYSVLILFLLPGAFFFISPMTESLILALTLAAVLMIRKKKWLLAGIFGMYCAFTKTIGIIIAVIYLFELGKDFLKAISDRENSCRKAKTVGKYVLRLLPAILIGLGLLAFMIYNKVLDGSFTAFMEYEKKQWSQSAGWFFDTARYSAANVVKYLTGKGVTSRYTGLSVFAMNLVAMFGILGVLFAKRKKIRASYFAYALIYFVLAYGVTWLLSGIRYMDGLFVVPLAFAAGSGKYFFGRSKPSSIREYRKYVHGKAANALLIASMSALSGIYLVMFCMRWQIW